MIVLVDGKPVDLHPALSIPLRVAEIVGSTLIMGGMIVVGVAILLWDWLFGY